MKMISLLERHPSSPRSIYPNISALAQRADLYTGDNFYFGFDSSNHSFLDIIGGNEPLAIKFGPIFCLYDKTVDKISCSIYYIDVINKKLDLLVAMDSPPNDSLTIPSLVPWSFVDTYFQSEEWEPPLEEEKKELTDKQKIQMILEQFALSEWPDEEHLHLLKQLSTIAPQLKIQLGNFAEIEKIRFIPPQKPTRTHYIAPYNPFYDNEQTRINFIRKNTPSHITLRHIKSAYTRIEIIAPGLSEEHSFKGIYKNRSKELYQSVLQSLKQPEQLAKLLELHFPAIASDFLALHSLGSLEPEEAQIRNSL